MGKTYDIAPPEVFDRLKRLLAKYHSELVEVTIRIDLLMASTDSEDAHAVTHGGYPAYAVVRITNAKERAKDCGDAEIVIDRDEYESMSDAQRDALLDHELYHLQVVRNKLGNPKLDDHGRPKLKLRKHDYQVGHFIEIARRHGRASVEVQQATAFIREHGQLFFGFGDELREAIAATLPTEDSAARTDAPFQKLCRDHDVTVDIRTGDKAVFIDKDGVNAAAEPQQVIEAAKIAHEEGFVTRSMLQRRLRVGYNRACAIVERLVAANVVSAETASGRFEVIRAEPSAPEPTTSTHQQSPAETAAAA